nr:helix-turn-helix domain-containing protein [Paracoccus mutanolyticus]
MIGKSLPKGMQISHFSVLNLLAHLNVERTPAELAEAFHVTRGAMTNTLSRLEWAGHIHIRPDGTTRGAIVATAGAERTGAGCGAWGEPRPGRGPRPGPATTASAGAAVQLALRRQLEETLHPTPHETR